MQLITQSFLSECPPLQKLKMLWTAVFFLRIWRTWILESNSYSLKNTFVTRNVYVSVELNAHSMILLLLKKAGLFYRAIAHRVRRNVATVLLCCRAWFEEGRHQRVRGTGPRNRTTDRYLRFLAPRDRFSTT
jgi:hypothetical protein